MQLFAVLLVFACLPARAAGVPSSEVSLAEQRLADSEYEITWQSRTLLAGVEAAWQAPNRAHGFRTYFTAEGIRVVPRTDTAASWDWGLTLVGVGRPGTVAAAQQAKPRVDGKRAAYDRGGIVEWYVNDDEGLEQGFTLAFPPTPSRGDVAVELSISGTMAADFAADGQAVEFRGPDGIAVLRYSGLKVIDARSNELPARMEPFEHLGKPGIRLVFDDAGAAYPVTVDPIVKLPDWTATSGQGGSWFGYAVATAGDVNGDGYSDVIVGAPTYDNGEGDEGRAYVYLGSPAGLAASPAWTTESDVANALYGWSVSTAGDVNGDGYDEVIVGALNFTNVEYQEGKAYLYYGSATGLATTAAWTNEPNVGSAYYGYAVATAGDVNNDGFADVVVTAPYIGNGRVYLYLGSASGLATSPVSTVVGDQASSGFGDAVATAGDVNGDGYADVIVGADFYDLPYPAFNQGRAYVYLGGPAGLAATPVWSADSNQGGAQFGYSVATAGDVNGDGYSDVVVGALGYDNGQDGEGKAYVFHGHPGGLAPTPAWTMEGDYAGARFGVSVGTAGDANGDGYADVVIGADRYFGGEGRVTAYFGSSTGLQLTEGHSRTGGVVGTYLGCSVGTAGDVDGDGFSDLISGSYGFNALAGRATVYRFRGADNPKTTAAWTGEGNQASAGYGVSVASAGDVNGDGFSDVLVGAHLYDNPEADEGRAYLYLGTLSGTQVNPSWTVEGNAVVAQMGISVASAGDVNGDGYSDIIVGANGGGGRAFVYHGSAAGPSSGENWSATSPTGQGEFGYSVASAGDVNGDGYSDVIVGARYYTGDQSLEGAAFVYLGSATGLGSTPAWSAEGDQSSSFFGHSVAGAGDVNGDGYSDVIVGAYGHDNGQNDEGRAYVYLGSASGLATGPAWTGESDLLGAFYGISVASAGDVNGDGFSDWAVASPNVPVNNPGCIIYFGSASGIPTAASYNISICSNVAPAGDHDNDGYSDVLIWPRARLYRGAATGPVSWSNWEVNPVPYELGIGSPVASAGDVNGDGYADVIVGANRYTNDQSIEGGAFVYLGAAAPSPGNARQRAPRQLRSDGFTPISLLGKSDSETGFRLRAPGFSAAGRDEVRLVWEVKPLGTPFDGAGLGNSPPIDTGAPGAFGSVTSFDQLASGLGEGASYHWRSRTVSANPFFPRSPWMSATGNGHTETKLRMSGCLDLDGDGYGARGDVSCLSATADCNDGDATVWDTPGPTTSFGFTSGKTTLGWNAPANLGTSASRIVYDTIRATLPDGFMAGTCVESNDGPDTTATDLDLPGTNQAFFYLNRARNACPAGLGSLGTTSAGVERVGVSCP
jgi:hypothetical protein